MSKPIRGVPLVISAPSGGGKTTLCHRLMRDLSSVEFSVSHTTRPCRGAEVDGTDYHFIDETRFQAMIADGAFLEWAEVHGNRYGTAMERVECRLAQGLDVLFDIDVQGGNQIAQRMSDAVLVFIVPPSMAVLEERLRGRKTDSEQQIQTRLEAAAEEIKNALRYTHWIVNDDIDSAYNELKSIVVSERIRRRSRQTLIENFFKA